LLIRDKQKELYGEEKVEDFLTTEMKGDEE